MANVRRLLVLRLSYHLSDQLLVITVLQINLFQQLSFAQQRNESSLQIVHIESSHMWDQLSLVSFEDLACDVPRLRVVLDHLNDVKLVSQLLLGWLVPLLQNYHSILVLLAAYEEVQSEKKPVYQRDLVRFNVAKQFIQGRFLPSVFF